MATDRALSYYDRDGGTASDGSRTYANARDIENEVDTASLLMKAWGVELRPFGPLAAVDWYALRHGRLVGVAELKTRSHATTAHDTVWLNVRKWLALQLSAVGLGVRAVYVVRFSDDTRWIDVGDIDASRVRLAGCRRTVKASSDVEPVIEIPVNFMSGLGSLS